MLYLSTNYLDGSIPNDLGNLVSLTELYLNSNSLGGTVPSTLGSLTSLIGLSFEDNNLSGTIPSQMGALSSINAIYLTNNMFTGSVPTSLGLLTSLQVLNCGVNLLEGSLPSTLSNLVMLQSLFMQGNLFTGNPLAAITATQIALSTVDLTDNSFSGSFPVEMFLLPSMQSVSLVSNCFSGSISSQLCLSSTVQVLALNGLTSGKNCRRHLFGPKIQNYVLESYLLGSIPLCVFNLSSLAVLQLSGNGLSGELPSHADFSISSSLRNVSLSHNRLSGTIPLSFQLHDFALLDLSFNKLSGTIDHMENFFLPTSNPNAPIANQKQLVLQVNRLSGTIPSSFEYVGDIQVVFGNLFTCGRNGVFPANDPGTPLEQCGSEELNIALGAWAAILSLIVSMVAAMSYCNLISVSAWDISEVFTSSFAVAKTKYFELVHHAVRVVGKLTMLILYWLLFELTVKYVYHHHFDTHTYQYAYTPSLAFVTSATVAIWTLISAMIWMCLVYIELSRFRTKTAGSVTRFRSTWRVILAFSAIILVDLVLMVLANVGYIWTILNSRQSFVSQLSLTTFKLAVNGWILPTLLRAVTPFRSTQVMLAGLLLCNNLLIPMFTIICTEPNCFSELFSLAPNISSIFAYSQPCEIDFSNGICFSTVGFVEVSYQPPFIYTYQCSSNMLTTYLPVFVMMYIYSGIIRPLLNAALMIGNFRCKSTLSLSITRLFGRDIMLPDGIGRRVLLFDGSRISVMFLLHVVTLLTFGTAYPLLSVLICTTVCVEAVELHVQIQHYLKSCAAVTDEGTREAMERRLQTSCDGLGTGQLMYECRWMVMTVMALFFSFFLMDMAGDKAGDDWSKIVWAPVTMLLWPLLGFLITVSYTRIFREVPSSDQAGDSLVDSAEISPHEDVEMTFSPML